MAAADSQPARGGPAGRRGRRIKGHGPSRDMFDHQSTRDALSVLHPQGVIAN